MSGYGQSGKYDEVAIILIALTVIAVFFMMLVASGLADWRFANKPTELSVSCPTDTTCDITWSEPIQSQPNSESGM